MVNGEKTIIDSQLTNTTPEWWHYRLLNQKPIHYIEFYQWQNFDQFNRLTILVAICIYLFLIAQIIFLIKLGIGIVRKKISSNKEKFTEQKPGI